MIGGLEPYPAYKDSGLRWLGEVPGHWDVARAKWLFRKRERPVRATDEVVTCFRDGVVTLRKNRRVRGFTESLKEIGYQGIRRGDLVIHAMDAFAGAVGVSDSDGKGTPVYSVCEPAQSANAHYYAYVVREMARSEWILALAKGIRERSTDFRFAEFASQPVPLPPGREQVAIVRFLEHTDRRIRRYVAAKGAMIASLTEQKQAVIDQVVTRGLMPGVQLKPSGVARLGEVPEHWEVRRLRTVTRQLVSNIDKLTTEGEFPVRLCNYVDVYRNDRITASVPFMHATASRDEVDRFRLRRGDVLITKDSELWTDIGVPALVEYTAPDLVCGYHLAMLRPREGVLEGGFLLRALQSQGVKVQFHVLANGVTRYGLSHDAIKSILLPIPPVAEQAAIVRFVDQATLSLDRAVKTAQREIDLVREYRTRLIADVVTGKLDVRDVAAHLPAESAEPGPLDDSDVAADGDESGDPAAEDAVLERVEA